jgi:catechol 2,3-dioxygenase-like lactoylglutathione lyase family enzyme
MLDVHSTRCPVHRRHPQRLTNFWASLLGRPVGADRVTIEPSADGEFDIVFCPTSEPKTGPNQMHLHLTSSSADEQQDTVARALRLGGRHLDVGQRPEEGHVVLADPEGNEFCVIEPGNAFLAGCGFLGELACDGTREVGLFWSRALGWPLVWDHDEETAVQSPAGGTKVAWGGPPVPPKRGRNRMHLHVAFPPETDLGAEVERLLALGAQRTDIGQAAAPWVVLADPDGNEFCLLDHPR